MNCKSCKHWFIGQWVEMHPNAVYWNGKKHPDAGTRKWEGYKPWDKDVHIENETYGLCNIANDRLSYAICEGEGIDGQLMTSGDFGCVKYEEMTDKKYQLQELFFDENLRMSTTKTW